MDNKLSGKGQQTKAIHAGESPEKQNNASAPHICMSRTFILDEPVSFSANNLKTIPGYYASSTLDYPLIPSMNWPECKCGIFQVSIIGDVYVIMLYIICVIW